MRGIGIDNIVAANIIMVIVLAFLSYEDYRYRSISAVRLVIIMVLADALILRWIFTIYVQGLAFWQGCLYFAELQAILGQQI